MRTGEDLEARFASTASAPIISLNDMDGEMELTCLVMLPLQWVEDLVEKNCTPYSFLKFVVRKTRNWKEDKGGFQDYIVAWAVAAFSANNKTMEKTRSQLHIPLLVIDRSNDVVED